MIENLISLFVSVIPLITFQSLFEFPKVFVFLCLGITLIIYFLFNYEKLILNKRDKWYLLWIFVILLSSKDILGGSYRNQGVIFFVCLWFVMKFVEVLNLKQRSDLHKFIGASVLIESAMVIFGFKLGTLGDINAVSGFLAIGSYFMFKYLSKWVTIFPIMAMIVDFSKSGFLSLAPYLFKKKYIIFIPIILIIAFVIKPINLDSHFENRIVIWKHSINLIKENLILGYGTESNEILFDKAFYESGFPLSGLIVDRAHNIFLDITLWSGIVGLFLFVGFLYETYKNLDGGMKKVFLSFMIFASFQPLSVVHWILFALIM